MNNLNDVREHLKDFETIWKCRIVSGSINLDINQIPVNEINFKKFPGTSFISAISITSKSGSPEFNFYAKDISVDEIESDGDLITIHLKPEGKIILMCTKPSI
ncbi:hypothetical protein PAEAM_52470 [Paenibacillus sp. GM1FR]|uniref:hypothetical protein n=1 Tax=Paenibacillus sp. GM1FR TaxID=2059267 RepID=UPI000C280CE3|nr:hypothetical protein [Paenibacillus sp. GM1FR]PJN49637.1 hypothetical protein PAEAM_52470 [Paenibacillus sp. GM1FR]